MFLSPVDHLAALCLSSFRLHSRKWGLKQRADFSLINLERLLHRNLDTADASGPSVNLSCTLAAWNGRREPVSFNLVLTSSLLTHVGVMPYTYTETRMLLAAPCIVYGNHTLAFDSCLVRLGKFPSLTPSDTDLRKGQQLHYHEQVHFFFQHGLAPGGWATACSRNCMKQFAGSTSTEASSTFAISLSKSGIPSFAQTPFSPCGFFSFTTSHMFLFVIPLLSSSPTSWPRADSCKSQPACVNVHAPCSRGCQLDKALHIIKTLLFSGVFTVTRSA